MSIEIDGYEDQNLGIGNGCPEYWWWTIASMPFLTKRNLQGHRDLVEHNNFNLRYHHIAEERSVPTNTIVCSEEQYLFVY